ncbi:MAG: NADH-quinone oxidoreductase subunit H, partial [Planctomycetota bacterium]|nr:NADH-quinone oxidoreductase subunit H [Planctomycetota bacterium]
MWAIIGIVLKIGVVVGLMQGTVAYLILVERKVAAYAQDRIGPNRAGRHLTLPFGIKINLPFGLLQPIADGAKMVLKEDVVPTYVDKPLYILAPMIAIIAATLGFAVVPFGPVGPGQVMQFQIAPGVDIGIVYVFAVGSLAVYGVVLAGYASNNKYSFLGGLRSSAQLISYELPLGLSVIGVILFSGSLRMETIITQQAQTGWWWCAVQPLAFIVFLISGCAECTRLPFDLPECEQELVA